jgi:hypothetical protein
MISNLMVLNSSYVGSRDLYWVDDLAANYGYFVYRSFDVPTNWQRITATPLQGHFYRDITSLQQVNYTIQDTDWVEKGQYGLSFIFRIPDIPYAIVNQGRPMISNSPDDVTVYLNGVGYRPDFVNGCDQTVGIQSGFSLPEGGAVSNYPVEGQTAITSITVTYNKLVNFVDIYQSLTRTFYTITSVATVNGVQTELNTPGSGEIVNTMEIERMDYIWRESVRRNAWIFEQVGEPAYLMFRKSRGTRCLCAEQGVNQPRTGCQSCYETGWVGGYYGPYDFLFIDPDTAMTVTVEEGGRKSTRTSRSFLGRTPLIQNGDMIVRRNGERLVIANAVYKQPGGTLVQQEFDVELLQRGDTRYLIPLTNNPQPLIYDPTQEKDPDNGVGGSEPVTAGINNPPLKTWENPDPQAGRTIKFSNIQR